MNVKEIFKGRALYVENDTIWVARGRSFWGINNKGERITPICKAAGLAAGIVSGFSPIRQLFRTGIHHLYPLANGGYLVTLKRKTLIFGNEGGVINVFSGYTGNKPAHKGICVTPEGTIFFGEYTGNKARSRPISLYRSTDNGAAFRKILTFTAKSVRHIHFIQWDKYENCVWMGTGDKDHESKLLRSADNGDTWELVGEGSQLWRAVGVLFAEDAVYWGTDAGSVSNPNYIIRLDRRTCGITKIMEVQGPCHGNAMLTDGRMYVSTGIEGGTNEKDRYAHVWEFDRMGNAREVLKFKKNMMPFMMQYGVVRFPAGLERSGELVCTAYGMVGAQEQVFAIS